MILPMQATAVKIDRRSKFNPQFAALAMTLQIQDKQCLDMIYFDLDETHNYKRLLQFGQRAITHHLSIFSRPPYADFLKQWEQPVTINTSTSRSFDGQINQIKVIPEDKRYLRINGWIADLHLNKVPQTITFLDANQRVVGLAITGNPIPEYKDHLGELAQRAGYMGYLRADKQGALLTILADDIACNKPIRLPMITQPHPTPASP